MGNSFEGWTEIDTSTEDTPIVHRETNRDNPVKIFYVAWCNIPCKAKAATCVTSLLLAQRKAAELRAKGYRHVRIMQDCCAGFAF